MKKLSIVLLISLFAINVNAQKIKLVDGDISFLKGQKVLGVEFIYEEIMVGKMTEADYIDKKVAEAEEREPGTGEAWRTPTSLQIPTTETLPPPRTGEVAELPLEPGIYRNMLSTTVSSTTTVKGGPVTGLVTGTL